LIKYGDIDISTIKDEALAEKIKDYQNWYNKAQECQVAIDELKEKEASLHAQRFELTQGKYENILQGFEHTEAMLNEYISQAEAQGHIVSKSYYDALISNEQDKIEKLQAQQRDLLTDRQTYFNNMIADGYSEEDILNSEQARKIYLGEEFRM
jgi:septal ring factor EnvC (AmiA/AmiB activator)